MRHVLVGLSVASLASGCKLARTDQSNVSGYVTEGDSARWPGATATVCWENGTTDTAVYQELLKEAAIEQYNGRTVFKFEGWGPCAADSRGIRIKIADELSRVMAFGAFLDGMKDGVILNFAFVRQRDANCSRTEELRRLCVREIGLHELGHAIGLRHEANRPDSTCPEDQMSGLGEPGAVTVDAYDKLSIMNYCVGMANRREATKTSLSDGDVTTIDKYYAGEIVFEGPDKAVQCQSDFGTWESVRHCCVKPTPQTEERAYQRCVVADEQCALHGGEWRPDEKCCSKPTSTEPWNKLLYVRCPLPHDELCLAMGGEWRADGRCCKVQGLDPSTLAPERMVYCGESSGTQPP